jgi:hypothetical protein
VLLSVCLLGINLKVRAKPQKLGPSSDPLDVYICHLKCNESYNSVQQAVRILTLQTAAEGNGGERQANESKKRRRIYLNMNRD